MKGHLDRMRELVNTADGQVQVAADAHSRGEDRSLESAHRGLGVTVRAMHKVLDRVGETGEQADQDNNKKVGTSGGLTEGTSSPPRSTPGLMQGDPAEFLKRARIGARGR
jgi:hypothetical protein